MSGHNKWSKIKRTKGVLDLKRAKLFTKLLREIQVAARLAGEDPKSNPRLRDALLEARHHNVPKDNLERAVYRGSGQTEGAHFESVLYEAYGPQGVAILLECLTDNRNRTVADLRTILSRNQGNLGEAGSVAWIFVRKVCFLIPQKGLTEADLMDWALEAGASDFRALGEDWEVFSSPEARESLRQALEGHDLEAKTVSVLYEPKTSVLLEGESLEQMLKLIDLLEDLDDVQRVHANYY